MIKKFLRYSERNFSIARLNWTIWFLHWLVHQSKLFHEISKVILKSVVSFLLNIRPALRVTSGWFMRTPACIVQPCEPYRSHNSQLPRIAVRCGAVFEWLSWFAVPYRHRQFERVAASQIIAFLTRFPTLQVCMGRLLSSAVYVKIRCSRRLRKATLYTLVLVILDVTRCRKRVELFFIHRSLSSQLYARGESRKGVEVYSSFHQ